MKSFLFGATCLGLAVVFFVRQQAATKAEIEALRKQSQATQVDARPARTPPQLAQVPLVVSAQGTCPITQDAQANRATEAPEPIDPGMREPALTPEADQARADEEQVRLLGAFERQPYDGQWAPTATAKIERGLTELKGSSLSKLECRSQLCRAEIDHAGAEQQAAFAESMQLPGRFWEGEIEILAQSRADGSKSSVVFLAKPGSPTDS